MTPFIELSANTRSAFCTIAVLLFAGFIVNTIQAVMQRRKPYMLESMFELLAPYFLFHVCTEVSDYHLGGELNRIVSVLASLPYFVFVLVVALFVVVFTIRFHKGLQYSKSHITPSAIKEAADDMSTGFCYYNKNGHPFLTNSTMNDLAVSITGKTISNGIAFAELVMEENIREINGIVYHFSTRELSHRDETFYELLADDITEVYQKTRELKENNEQLRINNVRMKAYGERINETVRREEILKSKIHIHNEMNKHLLQTANAINIPSEIDRENVLDTWMQNTILLCLEASEKEENPLADLYELARLIGVTVHLNSEPGIHNNDAFRMFMLVSEEAMTNAVKHAGAKHFYIDLEHSGTKLTAIYTNDGLSPAGDIKESGGLKEIRRKIEDFGGIMTVATDPYLLKVTIPLGDESYV